MLSADKISGGNYQTFNQDQVRRPRQQNNPPPPQGVIVSGGLRNDFGRLDSSINRMPNNPRPPPPPPQTPRDSFNFGGSLSNVPNSPSQVRPRPSVQGVPVPVPIRRPIPQPSTSVCREGEVLQCEGRGFHRNYPRIREECARKCTTGHCPVKRCYCECRNTQTGSRRPLRTSNLFNNRFQSTNVWEENLLKTGK